MLIVGLETTLNYIPFTLNLANFSRLNASPDGSPVYSIRMHTAYIHHDSNSKDHGTIQRNMSELLFGPAVSITMSESGELESRSGDAWMGCRSGHFGR